MLVVIEGPSAVGKTTLLQAVPASQVVAEVVLPAPRGASHIELERIGSELNHQRWTDLLAAEAHHGRAFADSDPLKLYYDLAQAQIGELADALVAEDWRQARRAMQQRVLGFADYVLFLSAAPNTLLERKLGDTPRAHEHAQASLELAANGRGARAACLALSALSGVLVDEGAVERALELETVVLAHSSIQQAGFFLDYTVVPVAAWREQMAAVHAQAARERGHTRAPVTTVREELAVERAPRSATRSIVAEADRGEQSTP